MSREQRDHRDLPCYGLKEGAQCLALSPSTVRAWSVGYPYQTAKGPGLYRPLIIPARREPPTLSFWNLVEIYVLASMRRQHRVSMPRVRKALRFVRNNLAHERPLIQQDFLTDGVDLFVEQYSRLINASRDGQSAMRAVLRESLQRIERDPRGLALRLYPWLNAPSEPIAVEINPQRAAGRLVLAHTGIPTQALAERFRAGESVDELAGDYAIARVQVEAALRWEQCALAA